MQRLREDFYRACFKPYEGKFASGKQANNKIDAEQVRTNPVLRDRVAQAVAQKAKQFNPDMLMAIPDGGNWLAIDVAWLLGCAVLLLHKDQQTKEFSYNFGDQEACSTSRRLVLVDDIFNDLTNVRKTLELPGVQERASGAVAIVDRGDPHKRLPVNLMIDAAIHDNIPPILPAKSAYWKYVQ